jgi:hypothetical protein
MSSVQVKMQNLNEEKRVRKILLPEEISLIFLAIVAGITFLLSSYHILTPILMLLCFCSHFIICFRTNFKKSKVPSYLHFNRSIEGVLIISMLLVAISYFFTLIFDGGTGETTTAIFRAELCVTYTYIMLIWVIIAGISVVGIYFAVSVVVVWFPYYIQVVTSINTPLILYFDVIILALMGLGAWITYLSFISSAILSLEDFMGSGRKYKRNAIIHCAITSIIGLLLILFNRSIWQWLIELL